MTKFEQIKGRLDSTIECNICYFRRMSNEELAHSICQLFPCSSDNPDGYEPEPDESKLLEAEHIRAISTMAICHEGELAKRDAEIKKLKEAHEIDLQMQAEELSGKCRQKIEEIFEGIEGFYRDEGGLDLHLSWQGIVIDKEEWEALKAKLGVK